jgi:DNA-binding NarL/FixJ family response regulator
MSIKRVILANHSRLLLEMFHRVLDKAERLEVVQDIIDNEELPFAIQRFCPDWVIASLPISDPVLDWISAFMQNDPSVRFIFLAPDNRSITMKWQMASEKDLSNLSLKEFIYLLEKDLQHI